MTEFSWNQVKATGASDFYQAWNSGVAQGQAQRAAKEEADRLSAARNAAAAALLRGDTVGARNAYMSIAAPKDALETLLKAPEVDDKHTDSGRARVAVIARNVLDPRVPVASRKAMLDANRPELRQAGYTDAQLDSFDPSTPEGEAMLRSVAEAGTDYKDYSAAQTAAQNADTARLNADRVSVAQGTTVGSYDPNGNFVPQYRPAEVKVNDTRMVKIPGFGGQQPAQSAPQQAPSQGGGSSGPAGNGDSYRDPVHDQYAAAAEAKYGLPQGILNAVRTKGERSNNGQVSSAGARSVYQFTPTTRAAFIKKYGVDAWADPQQAAVAAALHLKESYDRTGSWDSAIAEYHGGTSKRNHGPVNRAYRQRVGSFDGQVAQQASAPAQVASAPQQAPAGLPQGAQQIGTYKGRAVYQLPDGRKVAAPAAPTATASADQYYPETPEDTYVEGGPLPADANAGGGDMANEGSTTTYGDGIEVTRFPAKPGAAKQTWTPDGKGALIGSNGDVKADPRFKKTGASGAPKAKDITNARAKVRMANRLQSRLTELERLEEGGGMLYSGPILGNAPGFVSEFDGESSQYDATIARLRKDIQTLTRIPGVGSTSNYETALEAATLPSRNQNAAGRRQAIKELRLLLKDILDHNSALTRGR